MPTWTDNNGIEWNYIELADGPHLSETELIVVEQLLELH